MLPRYGTWTQKSSIPIILQPTGPELAISSTNTLAINVLMVIVLIQHDSKYYKVVLHMLHTEKKNALCPSNRKTLEIHE